MSGPFGILGIAASGVSVADEWLSATSDNIANVNTVRPAGQEPYRAHQVVATPVADGGVAVESEPLAQGPADRVYEPDNPLADAEGFITRPVVDVTTEMTNLMVAQRLFQVNLQVHQAGVEAYRSALRIGQGS